MKKLLLFLIILGGFLAISSFNRSNYRYGAEDRKRITKDILNNLVKENYVEVRKDFHSSLRNTLPVEKISEIWGMVITNNGQFESVLYDTAVVTQGYNQVRIRCKFKNENATIETTFNEDDKVLGLYIKP